MDAVVGIILCYYNTQEQYGSWQTQRGPVTCPAPTARQSPPQRGDDLAGFAGDPGAALWPGGMPMRRRRAAWTVSLYYLAPAARARQSALRAGRAGPTGARARRADRADASRIARDLRDQPGVVKPPPVGLSRHDAGAGRGDDRGEHGRGRARRRRGR